MLGCTVTLLESTKLPLPWDLYQASIQVRCGNITSRIFQLTYKDGTELRRKLEVEVTKFKYIIFLYPQEELRRRGIIVS